MSRATSPQILGQILKAARRGKKLNQEQAGQLVGITQAMVSRIERGEANARIDTLFRLLAALEVDMELLPRQKASGQAEGDRW
ncbi:MAG: transcriptional regulator [Desulfuromonas sp.]|nr:MAG: transcriptional regulator [Desulfuromonas sp.]